MYTTQKGDTIAACIILGKIHYNFTLSNKSLFVIPKTYSQTYIHDMLLQISMCFDACLYLNTASVDVIMSLHSFHFKWEGLIHNTGIVFACWSINNIHVHVLHNNVIDYTSIIPLFSIMRCTCTCFFWQTKIFMFSNKMYLIFEFYL